MNRDILDSEIKFLPGVGPKRALLLQKELGITTFRDMLYTFPFRYVDRSKFYAISEIDSASTYIQLRGTIQSISLAGHEKNTRLIAIFSDGTGYIELVFFKGIKWVQEKLKVGQEYIVFGKPSVFNDRYNFVHPEVEPVANFAAGARSAMTGVYSSTEKLQNGGISNKLFTQLQTKLAELVQGKIAETLPGYFMEQKKLIPLERALHDMI